MKATIPRFRQWFVKHVYATHNSSRWVKQTLAELLGRLGSDKRGINIGCGDTRLPGRILNVDIASTPVVDCLADVHCLPFRSGVFDVVVTQETLEHVADPFQALREISRVMRIGGMLYCQLPFIIGYHPGPTDYWRFTREGIQQLIHQAGLRSVRVGIAVGPGTGMYRILVEFCATGASRLLPPIYLPMKGLFAALFFPLTWLDPLLYSASQADRVAGGYFVVAVKD